MRKLTILSLFAGALFFMASCGNSAKEGNTEANTTKKVDESESKNSGVQPKSAVASKEFAFGMNMQDCDGLTYSEYSVSLKFGADNTIEEIANSAGNLGSPDFYMQKDVAMGTYTIDNEMITINFTKYKTEKSRDNKVFETKTGEKARTLSLKIGKCADGRLQLLSNMEGKDALGNDSPRDKSSWSIPKPKDANQ